MAADPPPQLFTRAILFDQRVIRRPLYFYVALNKLGRIPVERLIKQHGGQTVSQPKAADNQIINLIDPLCKPHADGPLVYSVRFVHECVRAGKLLDLHRFRIPHRYERASSGAPSPPVSPQPSTPFKHTPPVTPQQKTKLLPDEQQQQSPTTPPSRRARKPANPRKTPIPAVHPQVEQEQQQPNTTSPIAAPRDEHKTSHVDQHDDDEPPRTSSFRRAAIQRAVNVTEKHEQQSEILVEETSPPSPSETWTVDEDEQLLAVCQIVLTKLRKQKAPPTRLYHINIWRALKSKQRLPPRRSAAQCRQRAMYLRGSKHSPLETDQRATEPHPEKPARKRAQVLDDEAHHDEIQPVHSERRPSKVQRVSAPEQPRQSAQKRLSRTKQFIRSMVRSLSYETQMTQRRVFQVLRANGGDRAQTKSALLKERRDSETQKRNRR